MFGFTQIAHYCDTHGGPGLYMAYVILEDVFHMKT